MEYCFGLRLLVRVLDRLLVRVLDRLLVRRLRGRLLGRIRGRILRNLRHYESGAGAGWLIPEVLHVWRRLCVCKEAMWVYVWHRGGIYGMHGLGTLHGFSIGPCI